MNFLAHLYLSGEFDDGMVGNLMADFVTGKADGFPPAVREGIRLHREIDAYTDAHPVVRAAKQRLHPTYRHYSAVIMDVFYDHFLAVNWLRYDTRPLGVFAAHAYELLDQRQHLLPASMLPMLAAMQKQNWLVHYATVAGIDRALTGMAQRTKFVSYMENATDDLEKDYGFYQDNFERFFPDLVRHVGVFKTGVHSED